MSSVSLWVRSRGAHAENPRPAYEASRLLERPSMLERGSSTTKICQAVPTREYQIDQPSLNAPLDLTQGLTEKARPKKIAA